MCDAIRLRIPAKQEMMLVARMALTGFVNQCGADVDTLDDIRTLSDEACYCLMHQPTPAEALDIEAETRCECVCIRFTAVDADSNLKTSSPHDPEIARGILATLASDVRMLVEAERLRAIEMTVRIAPL